MTRGRMAAVSGAVAGAIALLFTFVPWVGFALKHGADVYCEAPQEERVEVRKTFAKATDPHTIMVICDGDEGGE